MARLAFFFIFFFLEAPATFVATGFNSPAEAGTEPSADHIIRNANAWENSLVFFMPVYSALSRVELRGRR